MPHVNSASAKESRGVTTETRQVKREKMSEAEGKELALQKRSSTVAWKYFTFRTSDFKQEQIYSESMKLVSAPQSNTAKFFNHLERHHKCSIANTRIACLWPNLT